MTNMMATFFTFGCFGGAGFAVFSLMGNGKKIEGAFFCVGNMRGRLHAIMFLSWSGHARCKLMWILAT